MKKKIRYLDSFTSNHTNTKKSSSSNQRENSISIKNSNNPLLEYTSNTNKKNDSTKKSIKKIFSEINNYQIESSSKDKSESQKNRNNFSTYIEQLELKIQKQAKRLNELSTYKYLCEKRIKQLNPIEELPINEDNLSNKISPPSTQRDKYDILYEKYTNLLKDFNFLINNNNSNSNNSNNEIFNESNGINFVEKYKKLKEKYNKMKIQYEKAIELLKEETLVTEEQRNLIVLLKNTIDNDLVKSGILKKYINSNHIIDFIKIKNESEEYRKELVLSQALVNSLKSEIEIIMKENKKNKRQNSNENISFSFGIKNNNNKLNGENNKNEIINLEEERRDYLNEIKILKNDLIKQKDFINNLINENSNLKLLIQKSNQKTENNTLSNNKINYLQNDSNKIKKDLINYNEKLIYFNEYISNFKKSQSNLKKIILNYIEIYKKIIKEDSNEILSESFIQNINLLKSKIINLSKIEKYDLDYNHDIKVNIYIHDFIKIIHDEFITIYDTFIDRNENYEEINAKIIELEEKSKSNINNFKNQQNDIDSLNKELNIKIKENDELKNIISNYQKDNYNINDIHNLKNQINQIKKEKENIISICILITKLTNITNPELSKLIEDGIFYSQSINKLENEKDIMINKILNYDNLNTIQYNQDYNSLLELLDEIERKIEQKENKLLGIKNELNDIFLRYNSIFKRVKRSNSFYGNSSFNNINTILNNEKDFDYYNTNIKNIDLSEYDSINKSIDNLYIFKNQYNNNVTRNNFQRNIQFYN